LAIIYALVKPEHVWKLFKWVDTISEQNKKGLRVMRTILEVKGDKKFKYKNSSIETMSKDEVLKAFSEGKNIDLN